MHTRNTKVEMKQLATGAKWNAEEAASQTALKGIEGLNTCHMPASMNASDQMCTSYSYDPQQSSK